MTRPDRHQDPEQGDHDQVRLHPDDRAERPEGALVDHAVAAERAGFDFEVMSDHYFPWLSAQGHAPYAWSVLGAVAHATSASA